MAKMKECLSYQSVQMIEIKNPTLGMIYYATIVLVAIYVIGYTIIIDKGYQFQEPLVANTMIKMKGSAHTKDFRVLDSYDLVIPPILPDAVFVGSVLSHFNLHSPLIMLLLHTVR
jgi:hypothetical protein